MSESDFMLKLLNSILKVSFPPPGFAEVRTRLIGYMFAVFVAALSFWILYYFLFREMPKDDLGLPRFLDAVSGTLFVPLLYAVCHFVCYYRDPLWERWKKHRNILDFVICLIRCCEVYIMVPLLTLCIPSLIWESGATKAFFRYFSVLVILTVFYVFITGTLAVWRPGGGYQPLKAGNNGVV